MSNNKDRAIVVKRAAPKKAGHHGGAWKLAYADFMTAMMAFFLLMWLLSSASTVQLRGIADYFNQPLKITLWGGDRSAEDSSILKGGGRDISSQDQGVTRRSDGATERSEQNQSKHNDDDATKQLEGSLERKEQVRLHDLQVKLMAAIEANPVLRQFKQQIRIDSTLQGLRIEIVDSQKRPMFATARDVVEPYMRDILQAIGKTLNDVPNRIVVQGHTDAVPYAGGEKGYSNWELSADRANASRRELIAGGMDESKVLRVLGLASTQNLNKADPLDPENRRISIIVLNKKSEDALMHDDSTTTTLSDDAAGSGKSLPALTPDAVPGKAAPAPVAIAPKVATAAATAVAPALAPAVAPAAQ
ncbi:flagellar motor protein MotB [Paraburkholderia silvatlantica]|uniref:Chemotaxis protein MotB n=1 Tax=Paraburkholderia silvatlantica TaxID=321895 RepID=A0ABR6FX10_9BURK|nr:flagellar motor protein MotB [Paraburkholderia silvatlantica]MBB2931913.1 chemotaxis protein MotB [Paraburkholderia silvatlantica]PVY24820.1 chemotaxis protein MotB [Paraburkholderia silvatlantica]PXW31932.1 chemotaxis protein MotB [Paraburkholderia silvatlantica]